MSRRKISAAPRCGALDFPITDPLLDHPIKPNPCLLGTPVRGGLNNSALRAGTNRQQAIFKPGCRERTFRLLHVIESLKCFVNNHRFSFALLLHTQFPPRNDSDPKGLLAHRSLEELAVQCRETLLGVYHRPLSLVQLLY